MASNGGGNDDFDDGNGKETLSKTQDRLVNKVNSICRLAINNWEWTKTQLRGGHKSISEQIRLGEEQDIIDIEDCDMEDDVGADVNKIEGAGVDANEVDRNSKGCESEDETYSAESGSTDTGESVESELFIQSSDESEHEEDEEEEEEVRGVGEIVGSASNPCFTVGMTFKDKQELKSALDRYAIALGVKLRIAKSDKWLLKAVCQEGCPFVLYASRYGQQVGFMVKTAYLKHSCARVFKNPRASANWLADHYKDKVQQCPEFKISEMKNAVQHDMKVHVSIHKCKRAKRKIVEDMEGSFKDEFSKV